VLNPYTQIGKRAGLITAFAIISSVLMFGWLTYHGDPLKAGTSAPFVGILALEFCGNQSAANTVLKHWGNNISPRDPTMSLTAVAVSDIYWDFLFIVAYTSAITLFCGLAATRHTGRFADVLTILAWAQPVAGALDVVENIGMLIMLRAGHVESTFLPLSTAISATAKFAIIGAGLFVGCVALIPAALDTRCR